MNINLKLYIIVLNIATIFAVFYLSNTYIYNVLSEYYIKISNETKLFFTESTKSVSAKTASLPNETKYVSLDLCIFNSRRTGNLMFTMAALLFVSEKTNRTPILPTHIPRGWIEGYFNDSTTQRMPNSFVYNVNESIVLTERYAPLVYDPFFENPHVNSTLKNVKILLLCGYFQSYKYTVGIEKRLKEKFIFNTKVTTEVNKFMSYHIANSSDNNNHNNVKTVGVHIRRTDFLAPEHQSQGFTVVDANYLNLTLHYFYNFMNKNSKVFIVFFISSDDMVWVNTTIDNLGLKKIFKNVAFIPSIAHGGPFDMCMLSKCNGVVTSTGSFSWWSGWLADTTTCCYTGYPRKGSALATGFDINSYYNPNWIKFP